jgi:thiol-disulfide isomerase/thioredoxin
MKSHLVKASLLVLLPIFLASAHWGVAEASDLASTANIFLYPKPFKMARLTLNTASGRTVNLSDYKGKVVLLHFWSIRCPACRMEEPLLDGLKKTFCHGELEIVGVNLVDNPRAIADHAIRNRCSFPMCFDGGRGFNLQPVNMGGKQTAFLVNPAREAILEVPVFPTTYIIDCNGNLVGYSVGAARWNDRNVVALLKKLMSETPCTQMGSSTPKSKRMSMLRSFP